MVSLMATGQPSGPATARSPPRLMTTVESDSAAMESAIMSAAHALAVAPRSRAHPGGTLTAPSGSSRISFQAPMRAGRGTPAGSDGSGGDQRHVAVIADSFQGVAERGVHQAIGLGCRVHGHV